MDRDEWVGAKDLLPGERVATANGTAKIEAVERVFGSEVVYNLEVGQNHTFYVGAGMVLVHNADGCTSNAGLKPTQDKVSGPQVERLAAGG